MSSVSTLRQGLELAGAVWDGSDPAPAHFGDAIAELEAARERLVLVDRSALARLHSDGPDLLGLLHRLSTADLEGLAPGHGLSTVLTSNKGRIVERLFISNLAPGDLLLVGSTGRAPRVVEHLARYTFAEKTGLTDITADTAQLALVGPQAASALEPLGLEPPAAFAGRRIEVAGRPVTLLGHDGQSSGGFSLVSATDDAAQLWQAVAGAVAAVGGRPAGSRAAEAARVLAGLGSGETELNEDYNPLEAGLREAVSFTKGCYVGQEVVARLNTYDKVSRTLVGVELPAGAGIPAGGTALVKDGREVGRITSALIPPGWTHPVALAYIKRKQAAPGDGVLVDTTEATLTALPW